MSESSPSKIATLAKLVASIVVAGGLVAALFLPFVGGTGVAVRNSADIVNSIPDELTVDVPQGGTKVLAADGQLITTFYEHNRTPVTSDQIAPVMKQAQVDIEDSRFYEHNGVDVQGTLRALAKNVAAGSVQEGGSTLTQQLVKQTLLQTATSDTAREAATDESVGRKLREARYALALEKKYTKDEILTRYLNMVYFGAGAYGIEAASEKYFSVHAKDLNLAQASMLAGLVQSPLNDNPIEHPESAQKRRNQVLTRMHDLKHISDQELADVSAQPVQVTQGANPPNGCSAATMGGFFCDYLHSYLNDTLKITDQQLNNGGYTIQTTLRPDMQTSADQGVLKSAPMGAAFAGILTAVQPGTGHVLAMSVNRRYGCSDGTECESVNLATAAAAGAGSTYKVFTAAAALAQGYSPSYRITAPQPYTSHVFKKNGGTRGPAYVVPNDNANYLASYDMTGALTASANTYFVAMEDRLGSVEAPVNTAKAMGMKFNHPAQLADCGNKCDDFGQYAIDNELGSFTLGPLATSPLDLASAYSTLAAQGTQCDPTPVTAVLGSDGKPATKSDGTPVYGGDACKPNAIPPGVANTLSNMLTHVVDDGTGVRAQVSGYQIAGKTGTINGDKSATFVGITPNYSVSVMYFNPKEQADVGGHGGGIPADMYKQAMTPILTKEPAVTFPAPDPNVMAGNRGAGDVSQPTQSSSDTSQGTSQPQGQPQQPTPPPATTPPPADTAPPAAQGAP